MNRLTHVIVGASLAGASAAAGLRKEGFDGRIVLIGDEAEAPYERPGMEYTGFAPTWDRVVFRGDPTAGPFVAFWLSGDRVAAGMNVNVWDVQPAIEQLVRSGAAVDIAELTDTTRPLAELNQAA